MPKSPKAKTARRKPKAESLALSILYSPELKDRASVREFVRSVTFDELAWAIIWAFDPERLSTLARRGAWYLVDDMRHIAVAAAGRTEIPLDVVPDEIQQASPGEYVETLSALAEAIGSTNEDAEACRLVLLELATAIAKRELAREAA